MWKCIEKFSNLIEFDLKEAIPTQSEGEDYEYLDPYGNIMYQNDNVIGPHSFSFMTRHVLPLLIHKLLKHSLLLYH